MNPKANVQWIEAYSFRFSMN